MQGECLQCVRMVFSCLSSQAFPMQVHRGLFCDVITPPKYPERILFCGWRRDIDDMIMVIHSYTSEFSVLLCLGIFLFLIFVIVISTFMIALVSDSEKRLVINKKTKSIVFRNQALICFKHIDHQILAKNFIMINKELLLLIPTYHQMR